MPEQTSYAPGTPSWIDLMSPDLDASKRFYHELFGWDWVASEPADQTGGYGMFQLRGHNVAGAGPQMQPGAPVAWNNYISVDDAAATAAKVTAAGGAVLVPPMEVLGQGSMALFADPAGAVFGVWQPAEFQGAGIVNEPGALSWNELCTRDVEQAQKFYGDVFGWTSGKAQSGGEMQYFEWHLDGRAIGGMLEMNESFPPEVPPYWSPYIAVDDADAAAAKVAELGGRTYVPPTPIPMGRFATFADPQGAMFNVSQLDSSGSGA